MHDNCIAPGQPIPPCGGLGLAHAYSGTCALDIDSELGASAWLSDRGINLRELLDAPDGLHIKSGREGRDKLIFRLPEGVDPVRTKQISEGGTMLFELRCATSTGATDQDVLPPSVHPDTHEPYWLDGPLELPVLPADLLKLWQGLIASKPKTSTHNYPDSDLRRDVEAALAVILPIALMTNGWRC